MLARYPVLSFFPVAVTWAVLSSACGVEPGEERDGALALDARSTLDASVAPEDADVILDASDPIDAGEVLLLDAGENPLDIDAGSSADAGAPMDASEPDSGAHDAGAHDAGRFDAGLRDAGVRDAGSISISDGGPLTPLGVGERRQIAFPTPRGQQFLVWPRGYLPLADGSVIIVGRSATYDVGAGSTSSSDGFILWLEASGAPRWALALGSSLDDSFAAVAPLGEDFIAVGAARLPGVHADGPQDAWMVRFDQAGRIVWSRRFGGAATQALDAVVAIEGGEALVAGTHIRAATDSDAIVARVNARGELAWSRQVGIGANNPPSNRFAERGQGVLQTGGSILLVGTTNIAERGTIEDMFTAVITADGATVSSARRLGVTDANQALRFVSPRSDGTFVAAFADDIYRDSLGLLRADGTLSSLRQTASGTSLLGGLESGGTLLVAGQNLGGYIAATDGLSSLDGERSQFVAGHLGSPWRAWGVTRQPDGTHFLLGTSEQGRVLWLDRVSASFESVECNGTPFRQALDAKTFGMYDLAFTAADASYATTDFAITTNVLPMGEADLCR